MGSSGVIISGYEAETIDSEQFLLQSTEFQQLVQQETTIAPRFSLLDRIVMRDKWQDITSQYQLQHVVVIEGSDEPKIYSIDAPMYFITGPNETWVIVNDDFTFTFTGTIEQACTERSFKFSDADKTAYFLCRRRR